eukprot:293287-Chlamydomonas_euryale.AAC.1
MSHTPHTLALRLRRATRPTLLAPAACATRPTLLPAAGCATRAMLLHVQAQAWGALVESVNSSGSGTALAAIGALMTSRWATKGDVEHVLQRLRGLPWQRVSVLREVVKVWNLGLWGGEMRAREVKQGMRGEGEDGWPVINCLIRGQYVLHPPT